MNDLDLCLEVVSRSRQPYALHLTRWISWKPLEIEAWFQTTNRKWHMDYRMVTWTMTSRDLERSIVTPICLECNIWKMAGFRDSVRTTNRKWPMGYRMVNWPMTSRDPHRCCEAVRSVILATAWLLVLWSTRHGLSRQLYAIARKNE